MLLKRGKEIGKIIWGVANGMGNELFGGWLMVKFRCW